MEMSNDELKPFLRRDFVAFAEKAFNELNPGREYLPNWHIEVIAEALQQCFDGKLTRLIVNLPPRSLKSQMISIAFPAWVLGHRPNARIICASYGQDLSESMALDSRSLITAPWYQELFPVTKLAPDRQSLHDFMTTERGFRLSTSVGGGLTGRGGDFIIIDDPLKPDEAISEIRRRSTNEWYDHTVVTRLNDKRTGIIIIVMQRLHEDDLVGHVLKEGDWKVLKFPAIATESEQWIVNTPYGCQEFAREPGEALHARREPLEILTKLREKIGEYNFAGQYQQAPAPAGGGLIKTHWFRTFKPEERPNEFDFVIQSWDTANKPSELADYSVCLTLGIKGDHIYLLDVLRSRLSYPDLRREVKRQAQIYSVKNILIEDKASGTQLIQDLIADGVHAVTRYEPKLDKVMRMHSVTSTIENGFMHLPEQAPWLAEYLHELTVFPNGRFDDQVDSTSQALDWLKEATSELFMPEYIEVYIPRVPFSASGGAIAGSNRTADGWIIIS